MCALRTLLLAAMEAVDDEEAEQAEDGGDRVQIEQIMSEKWLDGWMDV